MNSNHLQAEPLSTNGPVEICQDLPGNMKACFSIVGKLWKFEVFSRDEDQDEQPKYSVIGSAQSHPETYDDAAKICAEQIESYMNSLSRPCSDNEDCEEKN